MKKPILSAFLLAALLLSLPGCAGKKKAAMELRRVPTAEAEAAAIGMGMDLETTVCLYDFAVEDTVRSVRVCTYQLVDGQWVGKDGGLNSTYQMELKEKTGRIAFGFTRIPTGWQMAMEYGDWFTAASDGGWDGEFADIAYATAIQADPVEIIYDQEIPLAVQVFTDSDRVISYQPAYFFHPEEYEKLGYDGVFALTICFSQKSLY